MTFFQQVSNPGGKSKSWLMIAIIGIAAVTAGTILPQLLPAVADLPNREAAVGGKEKSDATNSPKNDLTYSPPEWPQSPDPKAMIIRLVLGTAIVLGLCVGTIWLSKRWLCRLPAKADGAGPLTLVDTLSLGNRSQIHLVGVGHLRVLVGVDAGGLKSLVPLSEPFEDTLVRAQTNGASPGQSEPDKV